MASAEYVTKRNPCGIVRQCHRTVLHGPHEWQVSINDIFDVRCLGVGVPDEVYTKGLLLISKLEKIAQEVYDPTAATMLRAKADGVLGFLSSLTGKSEAEIYADSEVPR